MYTCRYGITKLYNIENDKKENEFKKSDCTLNNCKFNQLMKKEYMSFFKL